MSERQINGPDDRLTAPMVPSSPARSIDRPRATDDRSVLDLVRRLADESRTLVREEVALAKAEVREKLEVYQRNSVRIAVGGAFLLVALMFVLWAVNTAVTALLATFMEIGLAVWIAPIVLGIILGLVGWGMVQRGKQAMAEEGVVPRKTTRALRDDTNWLKERMRND